jgi:16S rRNA (guanine(527)-N(7))-methyltransferase RsmG
MTFSIDREINLIANKLHIIMNNKQLYDLRLHAELLESWGRTMNLTAIKDPAELVQRHFVEGIVAGDMLSRVITDGPFLDLGSGNGFPAVSMAVVCSQARPLILVESSEKRAAFLRALIRDLGWRDTRVEVRRVKRASDLADLRCRVFTSRGVDVSKFLEEGLPFLESGGWCVLFGSRGELEKDLGKNPGGLVIEREVQLPDRETGILLVRKP